METVSSAREHALLLKSLSSCFPRRPYRGRFFFSRLRVRVARAIIAASRFTAPRAGYHSLSRRERQRDDGTRASLPITPLDRPVFGRFPAARYHRTSSSTSGITTGATLVIYHISPSADVEKPRVTFKPRDRRPPVRVCRQRASGESASTLVAPARRDVRARASRTAGCERGAATRRDARITP